MFGGCDMKRNVHPAGGLEMLFEQIQIGIRIPERDKGVDAVGKVFAGDFDVVVGDFRRGVERGKDHLRIERSSLAFQQVRLAAVKRPQEQRSPVMNEISPVRKRISGIPVD